VRAEQSHRPGVRSDQPDEASDRRRLPGAVRPEEAEDPAFRDLQIQSRDGDRPAAAQTAVFLAEPLHLDYAHAREPYPDGRTQTEGRHDGWNSGTTGSQPRRNTSTSEGGVSRPSSALRPPERS